MPTPSNQPRYARRRIASFDRLISARFAGVLALPAMLALGACAGGYSVEIRNESGRPILARIVRDRVMDADQVLAQSVVGQGESGTLGPVEAQPLDEVTLEVMRPGDPGALPTELPLRRGLHSFLVERGTPEDWSGFVVRPLRASERLSETPGASDGASVAP